MSYNNFIPTFWSNEIQRQRERDCVAARLCNTDFEGEISKVGDRVKILGVSRPTIGSYVKNSTSITPENLQDQSTQLEITQSDYFAFEVDDVDKRQAKGNLMASEMKEAGAAMAETADTWLYRYVLAANYGTEIDCSNLTHATVLSKLIDAFATLWSKNVPKNEDIYIEASPKLLGKILMAKIAFGQPNDNTINAGFQGTIPQLLGSKLYLATGVYNDGTYDYCIVRTKKAASFASQIDKVEAYRPESSFSDAVKGLHLYGAKVTRPGELVRLKCSYAAETTI